MERPAGSEPERRQPPRPPFKGPAGKALGLYLELSKAGLTALVTATTLVGFLVASGESVDWTLLLLTVLGTGLSAAGANALNEWAEARRDARMRRTAHRPIPSGRMAGRTAFWTASLSALSGVGLLAWKVNLLTAGLSAFVVLLYVLVYTPMKPRTPLCTLVGAVCGAIPPMMGWSGATGSLGFGAWVLAAILFFWQIPHFLALAWLYREDYRRGGFRMVPAVDPSGTMTAGMAVLYIMALVPLGVLCLLIGMAGWVFLAGSVALSLGFLYLAFRLLRDRGQRSARRLFLGSIIYLPLLLILLVADRGPARGIEGLQGDGGQRSGQQESGLQWRAQDH